MSNRFFKKLFMAILYLLSEFIPEICRRNIFRISFCWRLCNLRSNKPTTTFAFMECRIIHIHNWSLQPFSQDYWPSFSLSFSRHFMLCALILYISGGPYSLKSTPNDRFFGKLFMAIFIYSQSFCQKSAERNSSKRYFLYFVLMSGLGLEPWLYV